MYKITKEWIDCKTKKLMDLLKCIYKDQHLINIGTTIHTFNTPSTIESIAWKDYNNYLDTTTEANYNIGKKLDEDKSISIANLLGSYKFENNTHEICFYEKNINCAAIKLKEHLLILFRHLAVCNTPWYSDRNHFPLEYYWTRDILKKSQNYEDFIRKLSEFFKCELNFWGIMEEIKKYNRKLEDKIELLHICEREVFDCLYEIVFWHEAGHCVSNINKKSKPKVEEAFADIFALYQLPTLKEKVIFFSLAQSSSQYWFNYYKEINEKEEVIGKTKDVTSFINFLETKIK